MKNDCLVKTLKNIQDKNRSSFKQAGMRDAILLSRLIGRHFFTILKFRFNGTAWLEIAEALSACTGNLITEEMLRSVLDVFIMCAGTTMITAPFMLSYFISGQFAKVFLLFVIALAPILMTIIWSACSILEEIQEQGL
jgi:hypothetical protein